MEVQESLVRGQTGVERRKEAKQGLEVGSPGYGDQWDVSSDHEGSDQPQASGARIESSTKIRDVRRKTRLCQGVERIKNSVFTFNTFILRHLRKIQREIIRLEKE